MTFDFSLLNLAILTLMVIFGVTASFFGRFYLTIRWMEEQFEVYKVPKSEIEGFKKILAPVKNGKIMFLGAMIPLTLIAVLSLYKSLVYLFLNLGLTFLLFIIFARLLPNTRKYYLGTMLAQAESRLQEGKFEDQDEEKNFKKYHECLKKMSDLAEVQSLFQGFVSLLDKGKKDR